MVRRLFQYAVHDKISHYVDFISYFPLTIHCTYVKKTLLFYLTDTGTKYEEAMMSFPHETKNTSSSNPSYYQRSVMLPSQQNTVHDRFFLFEPTIIILPKDDNLFQLKTRDTCLTLLEHTANFLKKRSLCAVKAECQTDHLMC